MDRPILCYKAARYTYNQSNGTTDSQQLQRAEHTVTILSIMLQLSSWVHIIILIGRVDSNIVNYCRRSLITLSTCIRTRESLQAVSTLVLCELAWVLVIVDIGKDVAVFKFFFLLWILHDTLIHTSALFTRFIDKLWQAFTCAGGAVDP